MASLLSSAIQYVQSKWYGEERKTSFNLKDIIDELPAAREFFWYDRVPRKERSNYLHWLGQLITLFTLEHKFPIFPFREPSYFKKFQHYFSDVPMHFNDFITQMCEILSVSTDMVQIEFPVILRERSSYYDLNQMFILQKQSAASLDIPLSRLYTFEKVIQDWWSLSTKPLLVMYVATALSQESDTHANLLILKKNEGHVKYIWFNPHGESYSLTSFQHLDFKPNLHTRLHTILPIPFVEVPTECPVLQTLNQGGNCTQWSAMIISFLCLHPEYFDDPRPLLRELGKHPELNILIFNLSFFLRTLHFFRLSSYYYVMFTFQKHHPTVARQRQLKARMVLAGEAAEFQNFLYSRFSEENCNEFYESNCPKSCSICNGECATTASVRFDERGDCHYLTPKEIAKEMVEILFKIKEMTDTLSRDVDVLNIRNSRLEIIDLREAKTLHDYVEWGYLTPAEEEEYKHAVLNPAALPKRSRDGGGEPDRKRRKI